jgi:hypothetical protein
MLQIADYFEYIGSRVIFCNTRNQGELQSQDGMQYETLRKEKGAEQTVVRTRKLYV